MTAARSLSLAASAVKLNAASWPAPLRYIMALAIVAVATVLRYVLPLDSAPFLLFMPGMFFIGFLFGRGPGYVATLLSAVVALYFFVSSDSDLILSWGEILGTVLYIGICFSLVTLCDLFRYLIVKREGDLQATLEAKHALEASESFLRSILDSSSDCIKVLDMQGNLTFMSERGKIAMEVEDFAKIEGCAWPDFWQDEHNIAASNAIDEAKSGRMGRFQGRSETMAGTPKWWDVAVTPIMDSNGKPEKILSISRDISEQKRAEAQQQLLNHELGHRLKNMLAMIQAIANQTLRRASSLEDARSAFDARLIALGKAQDVLTGTQWENAEIGAVVRNGLAPHGIDTGRFTIEGPALMLSSRCSLALSLALHELATNAAKYGALSVESGKVTVTWIVNHTNEGLRFSLQWKESGGPPVATPTRSGFGSFMIERSLSAYFKGSARTEYAADGIIFRLEASAMAQEDAKFISGDVDIMLLK